MIGLSLVTDTGVHLSHCGHHLISKRCVSFYIRLMVIISVIVAKVVCVGSITELEELSGVKISDLHREK